MTSSTEPTGSLWPQQQLLTTQGEAGTDLAPRTQRPPNAISNPNRKGKENQQLWLQEHRGLPTQQATQTVKERRTNNSSIHNRHRETEEENLPKMNIQRISNAREAEQHLFGDKEASDISIGDLELAQQKIFCLVSMMAIGEVDPNIVMMCHTIYFQNINAKVRTLELEVQRLKKDKETMRTVLLEVEKERIELRKRSQIADPENPNISVDLQTQSVDGKRVRR